MNPAIREHFRSNVVGYIALFAFAVSGTAHALPGKNRVDSGDIRNHQVRKVDLAKNSVGSRTVINRSLTLADLKPTAVMKLTAKSALTAGAVGTATLADGSVTTPKLAVAAVTASKLAAGAVDSPNLTDGAVTEAKLGPAAVGNGALAGDAVDETKLAANSVGSAEIQTDAVQASEVADNSIDGGEIVNNSLTAADLGNSSVANAELAGNAVDGSKVANNSLTTADVAGTDVNGATINLPSGAVANGRCKDYAVPIGGATAGEAVVWSVKGSVPEGVLIYGVRVPSNGTVTMKVCNLSGGTMPAISSLPVRVITFG